MHPLSSRPWLMTFFRGMLFIFMFVHQDDVFFWTEQEHVDPLSLLSAGEVAQAPVINEPLLWLPY